MKKTLFIAVSILVLIAFIEMGYTEEKKLSGTSEKLAQTIANILAVNPGIAMDAPTARWGDYMCLHLTMGSGRNMVHFAKDPSKDDADIIMFVHAEPFIALGLKTDDFPQLTKHPYGPGLTSGQWYYIPEFKALMLPIKAEDSGVKGTIVPKVK